MRLSLAVETSAQVRTLKRVIIFNPLCVHRPQMQPLPVRHDPPLTLIDVLVVFWQDFSEKLRWLQRDVMNYVRRGSLAWIIE